MSHRGGTSLGISLLIAFVIGGLSGCVSTTPDASEGTDKDPVAATGSRSGANLTGAPQSDNEWERHWAGQKELAASLGVTVGSEVEVQAWIKPEEVALYVDPCIVRAGFQQEGQLWSVPPEQKSAFDAARYACMAAYPVTPKYTKALTDENIGNAYEWMIDNVIPCLEERGHAIRDVPSREVFIATFSTKPFYPFSQLSHLNLSNDQWDALEATCTQWPPAELLYGE